MNPQIGTFMITKIIKLWYIDLTMIKIISETNFPLLIQHVNCRFRNFKKKEWLTYIF